MDGAIAPLLGGSARSEVDVQRYWVRIVVGVATVVSVIVLLAASNSLQGKPGIITPQLAGLQVFDAACGVTFHPETCMKTLLPYHRAHSSKPEELTRIVFSSASEGVRNTLTAVRAHKGNNGIGFPGSRVCQQTLMSSIEQLEASLEMLSELGSDVSQYPFETLKTRLSAAMEFHTTCIDALVETSALESHIVETKHHTEELLSNALAFVEALSIYGSNLLSWKHSKGANADSNLEDNFTPIQNSRVFVTSSEAESSTSYPSWMSSEQQKSLFADLPSDVVVAKDGSGKYKSIQSAIKHARKSGSATAKRYVIRIKAGVYNEQVIVPQNATNFMFIGDGVGKTILTGDKSVGKTPGMTTFLSASLIVEGPGFIGKAITVRNTAGADGFQAVAMRVSADMAAFYDCVFDGFQDTLYTHTFRQYYRDLTVMGTVDFIFGNGAVAFQNCTIIAKKPPLVGQQNTYTAQGKTDLGQATGLSFQSCTFDGTPELKANKATFKTYLGRPWKPYSTHVNLKCNLMEHIDPEGWLPWNTSDYGLKTSFFAEWQDFGPGANTAKRVWWSKQITDKSVAQKYQAVPFTQADKWVPATSIPLTRDLP